MKVLLHIVFLLISIIVYSQNPLPTIDPDKYNDCKKESIERNDIENSSDEFKGLVCGGKLFFNGRFYKTIQIGSQCWLKENLNVGKMINRKYDQSNNSQIEKYCYNNDTTNCEMYGGLYQWDEAMQYADDEGSQGVCPEGWHIPSNSELISLINFVGNKASKLVELNQTTSGYTSSNETGFSALFSGYRGTNLNKGFYYLGYHGVIWSSTGISNIADRISLTYNYSQVLLKDSYKIHGFSIRCIRDETH